MPTLIRKTLLTGALLLTGTALLLPSALAQTTPDPTPAPPPPTIPAPPEAPAPPAPPTGTTTAPTTPPAATTTTAPDEDHHSSRFRIGPTIGLFIPTDSKTRDRFGSSWFSIGLGLGPVSGVSNKGDIGFDINLLYQKRDDNHALLVPIGVGYRIALVNTTNADGTKVKTVPYAGVTADYYLINMKSVQENANGTYGAGGGSLILGVNFGDSANLEARYQFTSKVHDLDFSGLNLTAGYRF
jgi:hypothetical protein